MKDDLKSKIASGNIIVDVLGAKKAHYNGKEVQEILEHLVDSLSTELPLEPSHKKIGIKSVKKGDVFLGSSINYKTRPFVVAKVGKECSYCIPITSDKNCYASIPHSSRYFEDGYYVNHMIKVDNNFIISNFIFPLGNSRTLNEAIKLIVNRLKKDYKNIICYQK